MASLAGADLLDESNPIASYYFDASDAGPTDAGADWTNDANAFDGSDSTLATNNTSGDLSGEGTTAPTSGVTIEAVQFRIRYKSAGGTILTVDIDEDSVGGTELASAIQTSFPGGGPDWTPWQNISAPSGGWTWQKVNDLAVEFKSVQATSNDIDVYLCEVRVFGTGALPEHLILGYGRCDIANTGRYFDISLHAAYDTSSQAVRQRHRAEGEDTNEQRIVGFATRHKASSGTPDVTMYGASENAGGGQNTDGGGYLIALPTSLFADFVHDYEAGAAVIDSTEATIATSGSYTPTVTGNHLIFGRSNGSATPTALGGMWVDSTTTEIRTGDSTPTHNQLWDTGKDEEMMATFQRYSITTAETFNLQADGAAADFDVEHRWLIIVNLNEPSTGATSLPHKANRTIRHLLLR